jgi:serine protease Do
MSSACPRSRGRGRTRVKDRDNGRNSGLTGTVSEGITSAFRENGTIIQITAPISPGSSGSPVLDENGEVIGVATSQKQEGQNLNFAIAAGVIGDVIQTWLQ